VSGVIDVAGLISLAGVAVACAVLAGFALLIFSIGAGGIWVYDRLAAATRRRAARKQPVVPAGDDFSLWEAECAGLLQKLAKRLVRR
jgi:hypothetical protein